MTPNTPPDQDAVKDARERLANRLSTYDEIRTVPSMKALKVPFPTFDKTDMEDLRLVLAALTAAETRAEAAIDERDRFFNAFSKPLVDAQEAVAAMRALERMARKPGGVDMGWDDPPKAFYAQADQPSGFEIAHADTLPAAIRALAAKVEEAGQQQ